MPFKDVNGGSQYSPSCRQLPMTASVEDASREITTGTVVDDKGDLQLQYLFESIQ